MTVTGPAGEDSITKEEMITIRDPRNQMRIPEIAVWAGQGPVLHPVYAKYPEPLQGFQLTVAFQDQYVLDVGVSIAETSIEKLNPEFTAVEVTDGGSGEKHLVYGLVIDTNPPFDGRTLPATGQHERTASFPKLPWIRSSPLNCAMAWGIRP
jgi:hypothetical protein